MIVSVGDIFSTNDWDWGIHLRKKSLTLGIDYKEKIDLNNKENENEKWRINNYFEFKLATAIRDKEGRFIPNTSTLQKN